MARRKRRISAVPPKRRIYAAKAPTARRRKSSSNRMGGIMSAIQFDSMIYGGLRAKMSNALMPLTSKIPLGTISDEVGLGILNYFVAKNTSGMVKNIALKGLVIENARLGDAIATEGMGLLSINTGSNNGTFMY